MGVPRCLPQVVVAEARGSGRETRRLRSHARPPLDAREGRSAHCPTYWRRPATALRDVYQTRGYAGSAHAEYEQARRFRSGGCDDEGNVMDVQKKLLGGER